MIADKQKSPHKKGYLAALQGVAKQRALTFTRRGFSMKDFRRDNLLFSLCGLNCGLCPMNLNQHCPGCGGGEGNQSCSLAKCSLQHENVEYCFQCKHYPCEKYDNIDAVSYTHLDVYKRQVSGWCEGTAGSGQPSPASSQGEQLNQ